MGAGGRSFAATVAWCSAVFLDADGMANNVASDQTAPRASARAFNFFSCTTQLSMTF